MRSGIPSAKKITVDIPLHLYEQAEQVIGERHITRSVLVREALERFLEGIRREKLERELREGYLAYGPVSEEIHREFRYADAELD